MHKKLMLACMAIAAFAAFIAVPAASASPVLTDVTTEHNNQIDTVGLKKTKSTNIGFLRFTISSGGSIECSKAEEEGEVIENSGLSIKMNITAATFEGTGSGGDCTSPLGDIKVTNSSLPWCFSSTKAGSFSVRGGKCTEASRAITFTLDVTGIVNCSYVKASVNGTYTTVGNESTLKISEENFVNTGEGNNIFCPTSGKIHLEKRLQTAEKPNDPIFLS
jgi:hypothetical protein